MSIGDNIRRLRIEKDISQLDLANAIGVSDKAISAWENNTRVPRVKTIEKIADFFGVKKSALLESIDVTIAFDTQVTITAEEKALLEAYRTASDRDKNIVDAVLKPSVAGASKEEIG